MHRTVGALVTKCFIIAPMPSHGEVRLMRDEKITEVLRAFDPTEDGYNKRAVKDARSLLRKKALPGFGATVVPSPPAASQGPQLQVAFQGKTYVQVPGEYLYVFAARDQPAIKIGRSKVPESRIATIEKQLNLLLEPLLLLPDKGFLENPIHHIFWDYRIAGEWFSWELTLKRWVEEMRALPFAVVVTRYDLAVNLKARNLAAAECRCRTAELLAA
jgi:uncharacterized protein (DUF3820 family)